ASDGDLVSGDTTATIFVAAVNDPPVGNADAFTTDEDTMLVIAAPGVLANDTDVDGDTLQTRLSVGADHGAVNLAADGSFEYIPDPNYNGSDSFAYDLSDGNVVITGIVVTLTINPVADPPAAADDTYAAQAGVTLSVGA